MPLRIRVTNLRRTLISLRNAESALTDQSEFFRDEGTRLIQNEVLRIFRTRGYGAWQPLAPSTVRRKGHDNPLVETYRLRRSLTRSDHSDAVREVSRNRILFGTSVPYAKYHERGTSRIPARPFLDTLRNNERFIRRFGRRLDAFIEREANANI